MPRPTKLPLRRLIIRKDPTHQRAIVRANARGDGRVGGVDRDGVGGGAGVLVVGHHLREVEVEGALGQEGRADQAGGVADHEGHLFGGDGLGGDDEVGFVFAGGVVEDDYEFVGAWESSC